MNKITLTVFALRHKATGLFMPSRMYRTSSGGWSYWEPLCQDTSQHTPHNTNPRIFFTEKSARNAQVMWEQGIWCKVYGRIDCSVPFGPEEEVGLAPHAGVHPRAKGDLEIVTMMLKEVA